MPRARAAKKRPMLVLNGRAIRASALTLDVSVPWDVVADWTLAIQLGTPPLFRAYLPQVSVRVERAVGSRQLTETYANDAARAGAFSSSTRRSGRWLIRLDGARLSHTEVR